MSAARALARKHLDGFDQNRPISYEALCLKLGDCQSLWELKESPERDSSLKSLAQAHGARTDEKVRNAIALLNQVLHKVLVSPPNARPVVQAGAASAPAAQPHPRPALAELPAAPIVPSVSGGAALAVPRQAPQVVVLPAVVGTVVETSARRLEIALPVPKYQEQRLEALRAAARPAWGQVAQAWDVLCQNQSSWMEQPFSAKSQEGRSGAVKTLLQALQKLVAFDVEPELLRTREANVARILQVMGLRDADAIPGDLVEAFNARSELSELVAVAQSLERIEQAGLPSWVWPRALQTPTHGSRARMFMALVAEPDVCGEMLQCVAWVETQQEEVRRLSQGVPMPNGVTGSWLEQLQGAVELRARAAEVEAKWLPRIEVLRSRLSAEVCHSMHAQIGMPQTWARIEQAEALFQRADALSPRLHSNAAAELMAALAMIPTDSESILSDVEGAVRSPLAGLLPALASLEAVRRLASFSPSHPVEPAPTPARMAKVKELRHPLSRKVGLTATTYASDLLWQPPVLGEPYGRVSLPVRVVLESPAPAQLEVRLKVELTGDLRDTPAAWLEDLSQQEFLIPKGAETHDLEVVIPIVRARAEPLSIGRRNLTVRFHLASPELIWPFGPSGKELNWQGLQLDPVFFESPFHDNIPVEVMESRPLGVEGCFQDLLREVQGGNRSFYICGPRRYGKTTLLKGLLERAQTFQDVVVLPLIVATEYPDIASLWNAVAEQLSTRFNRPVKMELEDGILPTVDAFQQVREEAARQGDGKRPIRAIYIVLDEAQAFFSLAAARSGHPYLLGERLKARLEHSWGIAGEGRAAIKLGLVGQLHMRKLMGANLLAAIPAAFEASSLKEEDLLPLLRSFAAGGLQSSSEARASLAALAGNLFILNRLLQAVLSICHGAKRAWFIEQDVNRAAEQIVRNYQEGAADVWTYVRDVLNESDNLNDWRPSETYPVALAWAKALSTGDTAVRDRALASLRQWAGDIEISPERVDACIQTLRDAQVLREDGAVQLPMLERFLQVRAARPQPLSEPREREALSRLGLPRIERPSEGLTAGERTFEGSQARVYPATEGGREVAVRCVKLDSEKAHQRFQGEVRLLQRLSRLSQQENHQVLRALPHMLRVGIDAQDSHLGVVVYEWIRGESLMPESLSELATLAVGTRLVAVLQTLEKLQVVHRDIKPENILIRVEDRKPVLIDFGLARAVAELQRGGPTFVGSPDFVPPEVVAGQTWTSCADLYSLGKTLKVCLAPSVSAPRLKAFLAEMTAHRPQARPSLERAAQFFVAEDVRAREDAHRSGMVKEVQDQGARLSGRYQHLLARAQGDIWACRHGLIGRVESKLACVAEFLENIFEVYVAEQHPHLRNELNTEKISLNGVGRHAQREHLPDAVRPFVCVQAQAVGVLRNASAHGARFDEILKSAYRCLGRQTVFGMGEPALLRGAVDHVAVLLERTGCVPGLQDLLRFWLSPATAPV
ncbi:serine/threonine kinase [Myxococcus hansupus]|uniref:Serine/threonine kinase n=1 Tax=Pseudomyxococcus hansupus TaxID=1297742 RepID=A0A0H4WUC0_9BACT|nr:protein kinase [Myxococcus hansupus]AKQ66399.1 serine/threonine kinase [Myxococcus hansupus]